MVSLWPSGDRSGLQLSNPYSVAQGVTMDTGTVRTVTSEACPGASSSAASSGTSASTCSFASTQPDAGGAEVRVALNPDIVKSHGVKPGDRIRYLNLSRIQHQPQGSSAQGSSAQGGAAQQASGAPAYVFTDFVRTVPILLLAALYAVVVVAVARWRGLRALLGLGGAYAVLVAFVLPGLVEGKPPLLLALVGSTVIMMGVLYFAHGLSARTSTALLGTIFGLGVTALLAAWSTDAAYLTGVGSHDAASLVNVGGNISISGIILCGLIISGLGALNDVTITQSSAVWELYELAPHTPARKLFTSALRIGRDHIASTVYTIAFAYAGAALPLLIIVSLYDRPFLEAITSSELAEEVVRTLVGSVGLVLAIPMTTAVAVAVVKATGASRFEGRPSEAALLAGEETDRLAAGRSPRTTAGTRRGEAGSASGPDDGGAHAVATGIATATGASGVGAGARADADGADDDGVAQDDGAGEYPTRRSRRGR
ncbi:YibE/F family protein [Sinomonas sp. R1AF57]|uniref:YibE/F family protein n=1 Tax=Sinomonas sp. R1AF57 TaxID=2020377 RepID=UPI000B5E3A4A|nr:YibE/F family protein [Sinomonas sp. R1AF57]